MSRRKMRVSVAPVALGGLDPFRRAHVAAVVTEIDTPEGRIAVTRDEAESPLAWLARRRVRGQSLITGAQFLAGERLRAEFTHAQMTPRMTVNWDNPLSAETGFNADGASDAILAARQRLRRALAAAGPEFAGLLLDVCCFLKGLETVERERGWPQRSAKIVLQLALDRLARHYGYAEDVRGPARGRPQVWHSERGGRGATEEEASGGGG